MGISPKRLRLTSVASLPAMARPCRSYGCPTLVRSPSEKGYCDTHAKLRSGWGKREDRPGSTTSRGYGSAWVKLRARVMKRDGYLCQACAKAGRVTEATEVDHIVPKSRGGTDAGTNLQALCVPCHATKTATERK